VSGLSSRTRAFRYSDCVYRLPLLSLSVEFAQPMCTFSSLTSTAWLRFRHKGCETKLICRVFHLPVPGHGSRRAVIQGISIIATVHIFLHVMKYESDSIQSAGKIHKKHFSGEAGKAFTFPSGVNISQLWHVPFFDEFDIQKLLAYLRWSSKKGE
jgi:hypothetical protein